jgi:hypothetical protein
MTMFIVHALVVLVLVVIVKNSTDVVQDDTAELAHFVRIVSNESQGALFDAKVGRQELWQAELFAFDDSFCVPAIFCSLTCPCFDLVGAIGVVSLSGLDFDVFHVCFGVWFQL